MMLEYLAKQFVICIKIGYASIDDIRQDDLKETVIKLLALEGLGPDGKPLPKEPEKPEVEVEEPKDEPEKPEEEVEEPKDSTTEEGKEEAKDEPKEPVEEAKEEEPSKDTKEEDKSPVEEDKGAK